MLADFSEEWPTVRADTWPQWREKVRSDPERFKLQVKKMLRAQHQADLQSQRNSVALWLMHRMACDRAPSLRTIVKSWPCRICGRHFRSRGGLGAHFHKSHARCAAFRSVAHGTVCRSCGVQYWTQSRLMVHLRNNDRCVQRLRGAGLATDELLPGFGSKQWQREVVEQFTQAPTEQVQAPLEVERPAEWSAEACEAYKSVCSVLFDQVEWEDQDAVAKAIEKVFGTFPLYQHEEEAIVDYIRQELAALRPPDAALLWEGGSFEHVLLALKPDRFVIAATEDVVEEWKSSTLQDFTAAVRAIDWRRAVERCRLSCVTPDLLPTTLYIDWEVGWSKQSGSREDPTAILDPSAYVPPKLRTAWEQVTRGTVCAVRAPRSFWEHPLSVPFAALRDPNFN